MHRPMTERPIPKGSARTLKRLRASRCPLRRRLRCRSQEAQALPVLPSEMTGRNRGPSADTEDEFRVVRHLLGRPGRVEGELRLDLLDARNLVRDAVDVLLDERAGRASHRGEAVEHLDLRAGDLDVVEQSEVDDVHPELGILDLAHRLDAFVAVRHCDRSLAVAALYTGRNTRYR